MTIPAEALAWLEEKCSSERWATVTSERSARQDWVRHLGGRVMRAGLAGTIRPADSFHLDVAGSGVPTAFVAAAKDAALTVLVSQGLQPILRVELSLFDFDCHEEQTSRVVVYKAAYELVSRLVGVGPDSEPNIEW